MNTHTAEEPTNGLDIDELLRPPPGPVVPDDVLVNLVSSTRRQAEEHTVRGAERSRRRWTVPVLLGGVIALAGAGTTSAYLMQIPPFQGLEPGLERTTAGIPVDYINYRQRPVHCLAFIEFADVTPTQRTQINAFASRTDWTGYGQSIVDSSPTATRSSLDDDLRALQSLGPDLSRRTVAAVAGLSARPVPKEPRITGYSMSCTGPGGQDGAP